MKVSSRNLRIVNASKIYSVPRQTIYNKVNEKHTGKPGHRPVFTDAEETRMAKYLIMLCCYGFPLTELDIRFVVKSYLDKMGRKVPCFKNNFPGKDWAKSFVKRNKELSLRKAKNISVARAAVNNETIENFFEKLEKELEGVAPENIYNYDETNLQDDPGEEKVITKRGMKYPESIKNSSKACTSLMFCGNAEGEILPPYINYKANRMHSEWCENGPPHARYNRTDSGWFDSVVFEDWFFSQALPELKKKNGTKVLIGDNLSSHINIAVLESCEKNDIKFIPLIPNSTHLLQPLDVAYFRPLKIAWRKILNQYKESEAGARNLNVPKTMFPALVNELMISIKTSDKANLKGGFRKSGIYPINKDEPIKRLCKNQINEAELDALQESFLKQLETKRKNLTEKRCKRRRTKVNVEPGKSISAEEILKQREEQLAIEEESKRKKEEEKQKQKEEKQKKLEDAKKKREEDKKIKEEEKLRIQEEKKKILEEKKRNQEEEKKRKQEEKKRKREEDKENRKPRKKPIRH